MEKLKQKHVKLLQALKSLEKARHVLQLFKKEGTSYNPHMTYQEEYCGHRDSMIQRFEYSIDLFWKYLKRYLAVQHLLPDIKSPRDVVISACSEGVVSEQEAEKILEMIKSRNLTSHMYVEEIAEHLAALVPDYFKVMDAIAYRLRTYPKNN